MSDPTSHRPRGDAQYPGAPCPILWGVVFAFIPALALGLLAGFVIQDLWVGVVCTGVFFGFGLDVLFGKGVECRQYRKH